MCVASHERRVANTPGAIRFAEGISSSAWLAFGNILSVTSLFPASRSIGCKPVNADHVVLRRSDTGRSTNPDGRVGRLAFQRPLEARARLHMWGRETPHQKRATGAIALQANCAIWPGQRGMPCDSSNSPVSCGSRIRLDARALEKVYPTAVRSVAGHSLRGDALKAATFPAVRCFVINRP
jgi:hypothetical protein